MKVLGIGVIIDKEENIIGIRIIDLDKLEKGSYKDVPIKSIIGVIKSGQVEFVNMGLDEDGSLIGTNGSLSRYPKILNGNCTEYPSPLIIINQIEDIGYTICDFKATILKKGNRDVVAYANKYGISNGKVVLRDGVYYVSSINGNYDIISVPKSKFGSSKHIDGIVSITTNKKGANRVVKGTKEEVNYNIENNDVFKYMTPNQKKVIQDYYIWYTVEIYRNSVKSTKLKLLPSKTSKLAELRGEKDWQFGGAIDTGFHGGGRCELGHSLRYVYFAVPCSDPENKEKRIAFGDTCASDFFEISKEDMKKLVKARMLMADEIKIMSDILANNLEEEYYEKCKMLYQVINIILLKNKEEFFNVFGNDVGATLLNFIGVKIPFPESLVKEARKRINKFGNMEFWSLIFPGKENIVRRVYYADKNIVYFGAKRYLDFIAENKIEGNYAYDPYDKEKRHRSEGKYNKDTRYLRNTLLMNLKNSVCAKDFDLEEVKNILNLCYYIGEVKEIINKSVYNYKDYIDYMDNLINNLYDDIYTKIVELKLEYNNCDSDDNRKEIEDRANRYNECLNCLSFEKYGENYSFDLKFKDKHCWDNSAVRRLYTKIRISSSFKSLNIYRAIYLDDIMEGIKNAVKSGELEKEIEIILNQKYGKKKEDEPEQEIKENTETNNIKNIVYKLEEREDIRKKILYIIDKENKKVLGSQEEFMVKIGLDALRRERVSNKQIKYIEKAYNLIKERVGDKS